MLERVFGLDSSRALMALKSTAAIVVGYGLGLACEWKASSIAVTVIVLQTTSLGATIEKATLRMVGTLSGALIGVILVGVCAQDREAFILAMAAVTAACVWGMTASQHQYAWMLVMLTTAIVGWPTALNPANTFQTSIDRVTAVTIGVLLSGLAHGVFWPVTAGRQFEHAVAALLIACRRLSTLVRSGLVDQKQVKAAIAKSQAEISGLAAKLEDKLANARADSKRFKRHFQQYKELCDSLDELALASAAVADLTALAHEELVGDQSSDENARQTTGLVDECDRLEGCFTSLIDQLTRPRDGRDGPFESDSRSASPANRNAPADASHSGWRQLLQARVQRVCEATALTRSRLAAAETPTGSGAADLPPPHPAPPLLDRLSKAALAAFQVVAAASFFILLDWPLGLQSSMILVMIFAYMNARLPVAMTARTVLQSVLIALPTGAVFHFLIMPQLDSFGELAPFLAILFFPIMYALASPNPRTSMGAILIANIANSLIAISTAVPQYSFASFMNSYLGLSGGVIVILFLAYLFENRSPRRGVQGILKGVLAQATAFLKSQHEEPQSEAGLQALTAKFQSQAIPLLRKLKKLSAVVDYGQCPQISRAQVNSLARSLDVLVMRLLCTPPNQHSEPEAKHEDVQAPSAQVQTRLWCIDHLEAGQAVLAGEQPSIIPNIVESDAMAAPNAATEVYCRSLAEAVLKCREEIDSIDWDRWKQNYF